MLSFMGSLFDRIVCFLMGHRWTPITGVPGFVRRYRCTFCYKTVGVMEK